VLRSAAEQRNDDDAERLAEAWHTARLVRVKRMPSLASLLAPQREAPPIEQARANHEALLAAAENN
jgi:hypothetical protein